MNRKKPFVYKRVIAYIIDLLIITIISGILTIIFTDNTAYEKDSQKLVELTTKLTNNEIDTDEYYKQFDNLNYDLTKDSVAVTSITCGVSIVYFVIMCYFCHGITLGKYIMKLRIVSNNDKELNILNYLLRSLVINNILSNLLSIILVNTLSKNGFTSIYSKVSNGFTLLLVLSFILIMYRNDGRGVQDFMGNTKVINLKEIEDKKEGQEVEEATIIKEEKKEVK